MDPPPPLAQRSAALRCKHEFCWMCLGKWSEHGSNSGGYGPARAWVRAACDTHRATCNTHRATCNTHRATCNTHRAACDTHRATCNTPRATCNTPRATCNTPRATCNKPRATCNTHRATCNTHRATCNTHRATCNTHRATCNTHHATCTMRHAPNMLSVGLRRAVPDPPPVTASCRACSGVHVSHAHASCHDGACYETVTAAGGRAPLIGEYSVAPAAAAVCL
jgi:hypothetical protein